MDIHTWARAIDPSLGLNELEAAIDRYGPLFAGPRTTRALCARRDGRFSHVRHIRERTGSRTAGLRLHGAAGVPLACTGTSWVLDPSLGSQDSSSARPDPSSRCTFGYPSPPRQSIGMRCA